MKTLNIYRFLMIAFFLAIVSGCEKDLQPYSSKSDENALATPADLQTATYGVYGRIKVSEFVLQQWWTSIYADDDVALSGQTSDPIWNTYNYAHLANAFNMEYFWRSSYKAIFSANLIMEKITDGTSPTLDQLKGENLYIRALCHFFLVRFFGRPYPQGNGENPGIPIKDNTKDDLPSRNTVKEVYDFIIADLLKAAGLMTISKNSCFASKETCYALLSRIYLYKEDNLNAIKYANMVIDSKRYSLVGTEAFKKYFIPVPENNPETIFAIRHVPKDDRAKSAIGNQFYNAPVGSTGYAETYASQTLVDLLLKYPEDARNSFIEPQREADGRMKMRGLVPKYYMNKYNWQDGIANLSSPIVSRLAEMYLIRAEVNAKLGNNQLAIDDVNLIRQRAGLSGAALYTVDDLKGHTSVLNVVLEEKRLEFFIEGHRCFDLFRNNLPMVRNYVGWHGTDHLNFRVEPTSLRVVQFLPEREIVANPNLIQNP